MIYTDLYLCPLTRTILKENIMDDFKAGIIANPLAGSGLKQLKPIIQLAQQPRYRNRVFFYITNSVGDIASVLRKAINEHKVKVLFIYGGDGTLHLVIDILIYELQQKNITEIPLIVTLGGGTMKAIHMWLGWKEKPIDIFKKVIDTPLDTLPQRKLQPLCVSLYNTEKKRAEVHYGFIFIIGAVNRVIEIYDKESHNVIGGLKHIFYGITSALSGLPRSHRAILHQFKARMTANHEPLPQDQPLSAICSITDSLIFGLTPLRGHRESNQFLCATYSIPAWLVVLMLPVVVRGSWVPRVDSFFNKPISHFSITPETESTFFLDGEFYHHQPGEEITISLDPSSEIQMVSSF